MGDTGRDASEPPTKRNDPATKPPTDSKGGPPPGQSVGWGTFRSVRSTLMGASLITHGTPNRSPYPVSFDRPLHRGPTPRRYAAGKGKWPWSPRSAALSPLTGTDLRDFRPSNGTNGPERGREGLIVPLATFRRAPRARLCGFLQPVRHPKDPQRVERDHLVRPRPPPVHHL